MSYRWPHIDEEYYQLLRFIEDLNANASLESMQAEMLKMIVKSFKAESGNFCLHESEHGFARKDKTALLNLSWQFTDRYIKYYHDLDPFIKVMPEVGAFRNIDLMPLFSWRKHEFNEDFIRPQKIRHLLVMRIFDSQRMIGHIGVFRHDSSPAFTSRDLCRAQLISSEIGKQIKQKQLLRKSREIDMLLNQLRTIPSTGVAVLNSNLQLLYENLNMQNFGGLFTPAVKQGEMPEIPLTYPPEVIEECRAVTRLLRESPHAQTVNRHLVVWQPKRQKVDVEILVLPSEQDRENGNNYYLLLVFNRINRPACAGTAAGVTGAKMTPKEIEISEYICQGLTNKEISQKLFISLPTVATHVQHILQKTGLQRRSQLISQMLS